MPDSRPPTAPEAIEQVNTLIADLVQCVSRTEQVLIDHDFPAARGTIQAISYALEGLIRQLRAAVRDMELYL
jgi:hypothetical protein